jgi:hypothetical protein
MVQPVAVLCLAILLFTACDSTGPAASLGRQDTTSADSTVPPPDSVPADTAVPPPPDTVTPPPGDSLLPYTPTHQGIPFGPAQQPAETFGPDYKATILPALPEKFMADLERARRTDTRVLVNFTGNEVNLREPTGFSMEKWKARVDRFREVDLTSYIEDGTIIGHFLLDEPQDKTNWNGDQVTPAEIDEMGRYSKERWPTMLTVIRAYPDYLKGHSFQYVDAVRFHYLERFGPLDTWIETHFREARALGLAIISGVNALNGGSENSGIPGRKEGKFAMSATELRTWGEKILAQPDLCAFFIWEWDEGYLARADIKAALADLKRIAEDRPKRLCRP